MNCRNPYTTSTGMAFGCGQCLPCLLNRRRVWMHRIMLEAAEHECNAFVTLTYRDDKVPEGGSLDPKHLSGFLKRLRFEVAPARFRFFAVGEYGDESQRPHYHAALFGFRSCAYGQSRYSKRIIDCCYWCDLVRDKWGKGHVYLGAVEMHSAGYLAGYVTKKMTGKEDVRLRGRYPEFARMSLRPGIGAYFMDEYASVLLGLGEDVRIRADVPKALRHGGKELPLGRYLTRRLRERCGRDAGAPESVLQEIREELLPMQMAARTSAEVPSFRAQLKLAGLARAMGQEARYKLYRRRKKL